MTNSDSQIYTMGQSESETQRLITQSQLFENVTLRFLNSAGIGPGMKVLDIGSGAGDVSMAASALVGSEGQVVGVDINPDIVNAAQARVEAGGYSNIEFRAGDIHSIELDKDFDAVIGRLVLMYLQQPHAALKRAAEHLKSGGVVAFQETALNLYLATKHPDLQLSNQLIDWVIEVFKRSGANTDMGFDLFKTFIMADLPGPELHMETPMGCKTSWPGFEYVAASFKSMLPLLVHFEIATADEVDVDTLAERLRNEVVPAQRPFMLPPLISGYSVLPE